MKRRASRFAQRWRPPIILAALTMFGLLSALLGEGGIWWWLSWTALAVPLIVIARYWPLRRLFQRKTRS